MQESDRNRVYYTTDLEQKKNWYSPVADAYNKARPRYPKKLVHRVVQITQLSAEANILEVGCGPGIATESFAQLGYCITCVEPSLEFCRLARQNCQQYPSVKIINTTFEECQLETRKFDAILSATAWHWVSPEIKYHKAAEILQDRGFLILLWNMQPQPQYEAYQVLEEVYQIHAPTLAKFENKENQAESLRLFEQDIIDSGLFTDLVSAQFPCELNYSSNDYLMLLNTLSPYIALDSQSRNALFAGLKEKIDRDLGDTIQLSYLSAFQIARKQI